MYPKNRVCAPTALSFFAVKYRSCYNVDMNRRTRGPFASAFTIVELLIVVVVIAILAAITIVAFNGIQNRTHDSVVQNELRTLAVKISEYHLRNNDTYPAGNAVQLGSTGVKLSRNSYGANYTTGSNQYNVLYCFSNSQNTFALFAGSRSGNVYQYVNGVLQTRASLAGSDGLCNAAGVSAGDRIVFWIYGHGATNAWADFM